MCFATLWMGLLEYRFLYPNQATRPKWKILIGNMCSDFDIIVEEERKKTILLCKMINCVHCFTPCCLVAIFASFPIFRGRKKRVNMKTFPINAHKLRKWILKIVSLFSRDCILISRPFWGIILAGHKESINYVFRRFFVRCFIGSAWKENVVWRFERGRRLRLFVFRDRIFK